MTMFPRAVPPPRSYKMATRSLPDYTRRNNDCSRGDRHYKLLRYKAICLYRGSRPHLYENE